MVVRKDRLRDAVTYGDGRGTVMPSSSGVADRYAAHDHTFQGHPLQTCLEQRLSLQEDLKGKPDLIRPSEAQLIFPGLQKALKGHFL